MSDLVNYDEVAELLKGRGLINDDEDDDEEEESGAVDNATSKMDDSMNKGANSTKSAPANARRSNLGEADIREKWESISGFNKSEVILSKKNSKDGLMQAVCDAVENLKSKVSGGSSIEGSMFSLAIEKCNNYIDAKNPWLPKGQRRKKAVIALRDALTALEGCDDPEMLFHAIAMHEAFDSGKGGLGKANYNETLYKGMKQNKVRNEDYAKKISKQNTFSNTDLNEAKMITMLKDNGYFAGGNEKEQNNKGKAWIASHKQGGIDRGKAIEPVFEILMGRNPENFMMDSPTSLEPSQFIANFRVVELAQAVFADTDEYADYIKANPNAKYANNFKDVMTRICFFQNLYDLYYNLSLVIMNPKYSRSEGDVFHMLKYSSEDIGKILNRNERSGADILTTEITRNLALTKEAMEKNEFVFGDKSCLGRLMAKAEKEAVEEMESMGF